MNAEAIISPPKPGSGARRQFVLQPELKVGPVDSPEEKEADAVADAVMRNAEPPANIQSFRGVQAEHEEEEETVQMMPVQAVFRMAASGEDEEIQMEPEEEEETIQMAPEGSSTPSISPAMASRLQQPTGGAPLSDGVNAEMSAKIGADFSNVQVHNNPESARMSQSIGAKAFAHGNHVYFNQGQYNPHAGKGKHLLAHELTHTVQQGAVQRVQREPEQGGSGIISTLVSALDAIGVGVSRIIQNIPGYDLFSFITGHDFLRGSEVERNAQNLIPALVGLIPGGRILYDKLNEYGITDRAYTWVTEQLGSLNISLTRIRNIVSQAYEEMDFLRITDLISYNLGVLGRHFQPLLNEVTAFATRAINELLELVKEALLRPLVNYLDTNSLAYRLATKVLGRKFPLEDSVEAPTVDILRDFLILIGKQTELEQMEQRGTLQETADWIDTQLERFNGLTERFLAIVDRFWAAFTLETLNDITGVFGSILTDFGNLLADFFSFAIEVALKVLEFVKKALLSWLSSFAAQTPGYPLIRVLLGKDPFTEEEVPRNATNIIHGFLSLLPGGEETFTRLQESGAIQRMEQWIMQAISDLGISWAFIVNLFIGLWNAFTIQDLVNPIAAFQRIVATFGEPITRLFQFLFQVIQAIVQFILELMQFPFELIGSIVTNAMQAYQDIKRDPLGFFMNLLQAMKLGFMQFFENIGTHLLNGVTGWLFGQLDDAGITPPPDLSFQSILNLILQILGISVDQIMGKIAERIGPERMARIQGFIDRAVGIFNLVKEIMERGPIVLWERIQDQLSNLWDTVLDNVRNWLITRIITQVSVRLLTMLDPTGIGAVINSAVAFFNAVQSFIQYLREMLEIINAFVVGVANIARGSLSEAANFLENALARGIPVAIGFLANQIGLGGLGRRIGEMIQTVRERVDRAINGVLDWMAEQMRRLMGAVGLGGEAESEQSEEVSEEFLVSPEERHTLSLGSNGEVIMRSNPVVFEDFIETITIPDFKQDELEPVRVEIQWYLEKIDGYINDASLTEEVRSNNIDAALGLIGPLIARLMRETSNTLLGSQPPEYGGRYQGLGSSMRILLINDLSSTGGRVTVDNNNVWQAIKKRKTSDGSSDTFYIRAHLLNNNLGGPGNNWDNLSILTQYANNRDWYTEGSHMDVEVRAKALFDNPEAGLIYVVTANYGRSVNNTLLTAVSDLIAHREDHVTNPMPNSFPALLSHIGQYSTSQLRELQSIIEAEQHVPTSFMCYLQEIDPKTGEATAGSDFTTNHRVTNNIYERSYYLE